MVTEQEKQPVTVTASTLDERMQSAGGGEFSGTIAEIEEEEIDLPGQLLPGEGLRLSNTPDAMPALIAGLRRARGMTQTQLGEAIGYPAPVIGNIEQGSRKLGLKTLGDLFAALGGELYVEYRQK